MWASWWGWFALDTAVATWLAVVVAAVVWLYRTLELHLLGYLWNGVSAPTIACNPQSRLINKLLESCPSLCKRYWPTVWLCSPHLQTAYVHFADGAPQFAYRRELMVHPDGGTSALDWAEPSQLAPTTPILIIVPGLSSSSVNNYVRYIVSAGISHGWRVAVLNHRGLGGVKLTSKKLYNAGFTDDLRRTVRRVREAHPQAVLIAAGASLGANILIKYLGEEGAAAKAEEDRGGVSDIAGAVAIGCPFDLQVGDRHLRGKRLQQRAYARALSSSLADFAASHADMLGDLCDLQTLKKFTTIREFDDRITRLGLYETVDHYYRTASCAQWVTRVRVPLLAFSAMDDPVCPSQAIPWDEARVSPNVAIAATARGGHLGFYEGTLNPSPWHVKPMMEFLTAVLEAASPVAPCKAIQQGEVCEPVQDIAAALAHALAPSSPVTEAPSSSSASAQEEQLEDASEGQASTPSVPDSEGNALATQDDLQPYETEECSPTKGLDVKLHIKNKAQLLVKAGKLDVSLLCANGTSSRIHGVDSLDALTEDTSQKLMNGHADTYTQTATSVSKDTSQVESNYANVHTQTQSSGEGTNDTKTVENVTSYKQKRKLTPLKTSFEDNHVHNQSAAYQRSLSAFNFVIAATVVLTVAYPLISYVRVRGSRRPFRLAL
eukprot:jgi/Chlat1/1390/Chrsp12S02048